jgi:hypothetical protein
MRPELADYPVTVELCVSTLPDDISSQNVE